MLMHFSFDRPQKYRGMSKYEFIHINEEGGHDAKLKIFRENGTGENLHNQRNSERFSYTSIMNSKSF